jgi:hypothetical protein
VRIFFNIVGYEIRFISEKYKEKVSFPPSPHDGNDFGGDGEGDGDDSEDVDSDRNHKRKSEQRGSYELSF